jgi:predicted acetyltransferase
MCADLNVQVLDRDRQAEYLSVISAAFGMYSRPTDAAALDMLYDEGRRLCALDGDRIVGGAAAFTFEMTVPGGALVPTAGVTGVAVAATRRRRGILRQLMVEQLDDVERRGEPLAVLTASESGIYRRFGYGVATFNHACELDPRLVAFRDPVGDRLDLELLKGPEAIDAVAPIYESWRATRPGAFTYGPVWWQATLGEFESWIGGGKRFVVVCRPDEGHTGGFAVYKFDRGEPRLHLDVAMVIAEDPEVEARLWRYLVEVDLVTSVRVDAVATDTAVRWRLADPRLLRTTEVRDWLHLRILDVPAALGARRYRADGDLVLDVRDPFRPGPGTEGRFRLSVVDGTGRVTTTADEPDLSLDIAELGSLYLGGVSATELVRGGLVEARGDEAREAADALLGWPVAPFCPTHF